MLFTLPVDLPSGQWSGSWFNRKTAPVGFEEVLAAHKGAFCFSSPPGSSTLLGNSLAADIILLCTEWQTIFLPWLSPPSRLSLLPSCSLSLSLSLSLPPYLSVVRCRLSFCAPFTQKVNAPMCTSAIKVQAFSEAPKKHKCVYLVKEDYCGWIQDRLEIRKWEDPTVKAAAHKQAVAGWMGVCLVLRSGRGEAVACPRSESVRAPSATVGLYLVNFCSLLVWFPCVSVSTEKSGRALCWIGLLHRTQPLSAHRLTNPPGSCLLPLTDISDRRIYVKKITHAHTLSPEQERKVDQRIFSPFSSHCWCKSSPWRDTWFSLSKRRSSFVNGFGFFFLERLLLFSHGCLQFKRSRLRCLLYGLYYLKSRMWDEAIFTRPRKVISWLLATLATSKVCALARSRFLIHDVFVIVCGNVQNNVRETFF